MKNKYFFRKQAALFFVPALVLISCAKDKITEALVSTPVQMIPVKTVETAEEVKGFGSLSFLKKFELVSPVDGVLETLFFREGDRINKEDIVGLLKNPQISLAARRAEDAYSQALSSLELAAARLRDGELNIEARLLENEKFQEELLQSERLLEEERRKSQNMEALYAAGGLSDEAIREERFRFAALELDLSLKKKELEIRRVGLRVEDIVSAGISVPEAVEDLRCSIIEAATAALRAETGSARANMEAASREMESARLMEKELFIRSPGAGIVGARYVEEGERIKGSDRILTIIEADSLCAVFPVPEAEAPKLRKGMAAKIISGGDESYDGVVDLVSPQADNQSFTFMVRVLLAPRENIHLMPGMFARVVIPIEIPRVITVIPEGALTFKKGNSGKVFTIHNNILSERNVVLGSLVGDEREIISGLVPDELVVLEPAPDLREGVYVSAAD